MYPTDIDERFREVVRTHRRGVLRAVQAMVGRNDSEDITQDVFLKVYEKLNTVEDSAALGAWIFTIAQNACLMHIRRRKLTKQWSRPRLQSDDAIDDTIDLHNSVEHEELADRLRQGLASLPAKQSMALVLFYLNEQDYKQIAANMNIPEGTVATLLHRARLALKNSTDIKILED